MDTELFLYLKQHPGFAQSLKTIFDYHYDQILREIKAEIPKELDVQDSLVFFMEESLNWPSNESLDKFIRDITK